MKTSLGQILTAFRRWLKRHAGHAGRGTAAEALMRSLSHVRSSGSYTREQMNER
jgi:hypothetical protein